MRAVITEYRHGASCGTPPGRLNPNPAKRDVVTGWSKDSARRNTRFLYSVDERELSGRGYAFTLTLREIPECADEWRTLVDLVLRRLKRLGALRIHWLVEWQRRGAPHLHGCAWFPDSRGEDMGPAIVKAWLALAGCYGALPRGQNVKAIHHAVGWMQYVSKHGARGVWHYQRSSENVPTGWKRTGRMWGKSGAWVTVEPVRYFVDDSGFFQYRRIRQRLEVARAKATGDPRRIRSTRRMLRTSSVELGRVRGVSTWIDWETNARIIAWLAGEGYAVRC